MQTDITLNDLIALLRKEGFESDAGGFFTVWGN